MYKFLANFLLYTLNRQSLGIMHFPRVISFFFNAINKCTVIDISQKCFRQN